jgi:AcrR family transcriptional regulator
MALYWHFRSKDELLDGMAARLLEEVDLPVDGSLAWQDELRAVLDSLAAVLGAHPSTARLLPTRTVSSEGSLRATETLLDILRRGGFSPVDATQIARHALNTIANLAAAPTGAVARDESGGTADARRDAREFLQSLSPERYPRLIEAAEPLSEGIDPAAYIVLGIELLLAGIGAMARRPT